MKGWYLAARIVLFIFAVVGILKAVGVFSSSPSGPEAHVCFTVDLAANGAQCDNDESIVRARDLPGAYVSVQTNTSGAATDTMRILISHKNAAGTYVDDGDTDVDLGGDSLFDNVFATKLKDVVDTAGVTLVPGTTYHLKAENVSSGDALDSTDLGFDDFSDPVTVPLGSVDFTYQA